MPEHSSQHPTSVVVSEGVHLNPRSENDEEHGSSTQGMRVVAERNDLSVYSDFALYRSLDLISRQKR